MKIVELGEFRVNIEERRLYKQQEELFAEPKVIEVLCYFIQHGERFVSLQELHQQVWKGRVVTDTAVRRTVSKLRTLLGDHDTEQPRYIRSQMKRGYQLACSATEYHGTLSENSSGNLTGKTSASFSKFSKIFVLVGCITLAVAVPTIFSILLSEPILQTESHHVILDIPGQKASLAVSADGRYQAFVGRISSTDNWQLFLYDKQNGQLTKVPTPVPHVRFVDFVADSSLLAYVGFRGDKAEFYLQSLSDLQEAPEQILLKGLPLLAGPLALPDNTLLIAGGEAYNGNIHYYQYDLKTRMLSQFSYSSIAGVQDAYARLSPDSQQIALIRANIAERKLYLQLYRLSDKELLYERLLSNSLADIRVAWLNSHNLLIKGNGSFELLELQNKSSHTLDAGAFNVKELILDGKGQYFAIYRKAAEQQLYKTGWPYEQGFSQHLQLDPGVQSVYFSYDNHYYWLIEQHEKQYQLSRYFPADARRQAVMQSAAAFDILDQAPDMPLLLLKRNNRLELLDVESGISTNLSLSTQQVDRGVFAADGTTVYFTVFSAGQWRVMKYLLHSASLHPVAHDYRYFQPYKEGYVAADSTGKLWQLNAELVQQRQLYEGIHFDLDYRFMLRGDQLNIVHRTLMSDWKLVKIDLQQNNIWQRKLSFNEFSANFSLSHSTDELLFFKPKIDTNQIITGSYNFGYNSLF